MTLAAWFLRQSLVLDWKLLQFPAWTIPRKLAFIARKYQLIALHMVRPFEFGQSSTRLGDETIFYDSRFGLAGYQSMLTRPGAMLKTAFLGSIETVIDCGANVGFFTKMITHLAPDARVYAIEPIPVIFDALRRNTASRPNVRVFQIAISDRRGHARMSFDSAFSAISHLSQSGNVEVTTTTLDDFTAEHQIGTVDLLKIDTETFEAHVLRGAAATLARTRYLLIEVTIEGNRNYSISSLMALLNSSEFDFQLVAFRNHADRGEGGIPIMDCLLVNQVLSRTSPVSP